MPGGLNTEAAEAFEPLASSRGDSAHRTVDFPWLVGTVS